MERIPAADIDQVVFKQIGLLCARDEAVVDAPAGMALIAGYNQLFMAQARSRIESVDGRNEIWHSLTFYDKRDANDFYEIQVNDSGLVLYADSDLDGELRIADLSDESYRAKLWHTFMMLDGVEWYGPEADPGWVESEIHREN